MEKFVLSIADVFGKKKRNKILKKHQIYLDVCSISYEKPEQRPKYINNYKIIEEYNFIKSCVYLNKKKNHGIFCYRGTNDYEDLISSDYDIFKGNFKNNKRYKEELENVKSIKNKYKNFTWSHTGHSLGGTIALDISSKYKNDYVCSFNPGQSTDVVNNKDINGVNYVRYGDIVSLFSIIKYPNNTIIIKPKLGYYKSHLLKYFYQI